MERLGYRFDILCDYGIFRDLQRHRMLTLDWQRLGTGHGFVTPASIDDIGARSLWDEAMERTAASAWRACADPRPGRRPVRRARLRTGSASSSNSTPARRSTCSSCGSGQGGHPDYRRVAQEMHRLIGDQAGHRVIADAMRYVDYEDYDLARLEERAAGGGKAGCARHLRPRLPLTHRSGAGTVGQATTHRRADHPTPRQEASSPSPSAPSRRAGS